MSHIEALEQIRNFNARFFRRQVEPKDDPPAEGIVYGRASKKLTRNEAFKRVVAQEIKTPRPDEIRRKLYGR